MRNVPSTADRADEVADGVTSLEKGLAVLERLSTSHDGAGVTELARELSLPKSTIARLLAVLRSRGYAWREAARPRYRLGHRALELTANALDDLAVVGHGRPHLYELAGRSSRVACLGVLWDEVIVVVDIVEPPAAAPAALAHEPLEVGRSLTHTSSIGKVILAHRSEVAVERFLATGPLVRRTERTITDPDVLRAHLAHVRECGWAINDGESTQGGTSVAAAVFNHAGDVGAAGSVMDSHQVGLQPPAEIVAAVREAGRRVSFNLGHHPRAAR